MTRLAIGALALVGGLLALNPVYAGSTYQERLDAMRARQAADSVLASEQPPAAPPQKPKKPVVVNKIFFENGDRVTGKLNSIRSKDISFDAFASSAIKAPFASVVDIQTEGTYEITLRDGSILVGTFRPTGKPETFGVSTLTGLEKINRDHVVGVETKSYAIARRAELKEKGIVRLGKVWSGYLDAAYSESSGNTETRNLQISAEANRKTSVDKLRMAFLTNNSSASGAKTAQRSSGDVRMDLFLRNNLFYFVQGRLETDELEQVDLRTTLGAGLGKRWEGANDLKASFGLGYSYVREAFANNTDNSEGSLLITFDLERALGRNVSFEHRLIAYPNINDSEFRFQATTNFKSALSRNLSFVVGFFNKYDSDPLAGIEKNDLTITTGLRRDF